MKIKVLIMMLFCSVVGWGQVTIATQDFETVPAVPTWTYSNSGGGTSATNTGTPNNQRIRNGARSFQVSNEGSTITFPNFSVTGYSSVKVIVRLSSISGTLGNGADAAEHIRLFANVDNAGFSTNTQANADIAVNGNTNSRWGYNTTGATTNAGTNLVVTGTASTNSGTIYSTLTINIPDGSSTVGLRINFLNNDTDEFWCVDDILLEGIVSTPQPEINITQGSTILTGGTHNFGNVNIGSNSDVVFTIQNTGSAALNLTSLPLTTTGDYSIISQPTSPIAAGGSSTFTVRFTPTISGTRIGSISIPNNDTSGSENPYVVNFTGNGTCVPFTFSSFAPASGPVGTEVTITAASGNLTGCTVNFNGTPATIVSVIATQIIVTVPSGATTGLINVTNTATGCVSSTSSFTIINQDITSCEGGAGTTSNLFFSEVTDATTGGMTYLEIYNATGNPVNLSGYEIRTYGNGSNGDGTAGNPAPIVLTLNNVVLNNLDMYIIALGIAGSPSSTNTCDVDGDSIYGNDGGNGDFADQTSLSGGINFDPTGTPGNANDFIGLYQGSTLIDSFGVFASLTWANGLSLGDRGATFRRLATATLPNTTFSSTDWTIIDYAGTGQVSCSTNDYSDIGFYNYSLQTLPSITTQPSLALTCTSTSAAISVVGAEGVSGGLGLAYQWFAISTTGVWTALTNAGVYTGATSATLNISTLTGLNGYQYYCQVLENSATCYVASVAVKINTGATTWNGTAWSNGFPGINNVVIIAGNYNTSSPFPEGSFDACSVTVNSSTTLTISANTFVNIENQLTNNGTVTVENNGSLVQINDAPATANTGNITMQRTATGVVSGEDYVYWSAPITGQTVNGVFSGSSPRYSWETTTTNANGGQGTWVPYTGAMSAGSGYIVRDNSSANFTGVPHNGIFTPAIARGTDFTTPGTQLIPRTATDDNWNLLGNPYPSAISVNRFLDLNPQLEGFINVWTHGQSPTNAVDPFYQNFVLNYFANDYVQYNSTGNNNNPSDFEIASGQGFMALMDTGIAGTSTALFNNSMRNKDYDNSQFFRTVNKQNTTKNRIWVDLESPNESSRTMFGYVPNATNGLDDRYDAFTDLKSNLKFYSIIEDKIYGIQGKSLPFINTDFVLVGFKTATNGSHTIALAVTDGLFANNGQTIYLEDKLLDVWHNLSLNPYDFTATAGTYNNRFVIRYLDRALSTNDFETVNNNVIIFGNTVGIKINSSLSTIKSYVVYNILGQTLASESNLNNNEYVVKNMMKNDQVLIVKATLNNGQVVTRKVIY